jgi:hypothetical protein
MDEVYAQQIKAMIKDAVSEAVSAHSLTPEEQRWVRLAIQRESQSIAFRRAVIQHSTVGLVWAAIVWVGVVFYEYLKNHGWKP